MNCTLQLSLLTLLAGYAGSLSAATLAEAERALAARDVTRARSLSEALCREFGTLDREWGPAHLLRARVELVAGGTPAAIAQLSELRKNASLDDVTRRAAAGLEISLTADVVVRIELAQKYLVLWPTHADAVAIWQTATHDREQTRGVVPALDFLQSRPAMLRAQTQTDAPLRTEEIRLRQLLKNPPPVSPPAISAEAEKAFAGGDFAKAERLFGEACTAHHSAPVRMRAFVRKLACAEILLRGESAAREAVVGLPGLPAAAFPPALRLTLARLRFEHLGETTQGEPLATGALAELPAAAPECEDARWLLARMLAWRKAPRAEIEAVLHESPLLSDCPHEPESPLHPVSRLLAYTDRAEGWLAADFGAPLSPPAHPLVRAADTCFAATRFADAVRLYTQYLRTPALSRDAHAYAVLQQARALAHTDRPGEALARYRLFVTDKDLARSPLAPAARLRAGVLCAGPLADAGAALAWYEDLLRDAPQAPETRLAAAYRIALLEIHRPAASAAAKQAYIRTHFGDPLSRRYEQSLRPRPTLKKP